MNPFKITAWIALSLLYVVGPYYPGIALGQKMGIPFFPVILLVGIYAIVYLYIKSQRPKFCATDTRCSHLFLKFSRVYLAVGCGSLVMFEFLG